MDGSPLAADTASCRSGYEPNTIHISTFWPARVPNHDQRDEDKRVIDIRLPLKDRLEFSIHDQCG